MADGQKGLKLYNTLTRVKEEFFPIDTENVRIYVCGPTVYDFAHIGNARPAIVFDVLFRLLRHLYPGPGKGADGSRVTYVRNITDVDDKINARAARDFPDLPLNEAIRRVTEKTNDQYQKDVAALGCLEPTFQPRATEFVLPRPDGKADMVTLIQRLIERGHAYEAKGEILFDTASMAEYGQLSRRPLDEQQAGARVAVEAHKKNPQDFVLWKESSAEEPGWDASFTLPGGRTATIRGRPGWHIECSAMSAAYLDEVFDIHGGGLDLIFPHHENEIAQSRCAHGTDAMANYWMHNGFLQVEGRKMSKSEGNFVTIRDNLRGIFPGWNEGPWSGIVLRVAMLLTHYRQPIDWTLERLLEARQIANRWHLAIRLWLDDEWLEFQDHKFKNVKGKISDEFVGHLLDDLNTPLAIKSLDELCDRAFVDAVAREDLIATLRDFGLLTETSFKDDASLSIGPILGSRPVPRDAARKFATATANNDIQLIDGFRREIEETGYSVRWIAADQVDLSPNVEAVNVQSLVSERLAFIREKKWAEADRIRDELLAQGIQLKDGKDPVTAERVTTWEVKR